MKNQEQEKAGWGAKVIDRMSYDLKEEFPDMQGFSARNLKYMRKLAQEWPNREIVQRAAAQIPWRNNQAIFLLYLLNRNPAFLELI